ncbi:MAG: hypothetical protein DWH91_05965 [Planctomycetota bacterium]|nr:MAG: hypothetical protein DWH91_05965 [Planctomycetota bacterium]
MDKAFWVAVFTTTIAGVGVAQDYVGPSSVGSSEQLYPYDDQEKWKHGYLKEMPYYHGQHSFKPSNYHHIYSQSQTAAGWGMNPNAPYSQQFWHKYEQAASPGTPILTREERIYREDQIVRMQLQNQAQQQLQMQQRVNGTSFVVGATLPMNTQEVAPVVYQSTVPTLPNGAPVYTPDIAPRQSDPSLKDVQREELRSYLANPQNR